MTLRFVPTPLRGPTAVPALREGGIAPALLEAIVPAPGTEAILARLREPDVLVVTTGQQPALFTGPLYTVHKALSAAAVARLLEERWERPVVPLFWSAGDDHDFEEAGGAAWPAADGSLRAVRLPPRPADAPLVPLWRTPLGAEVDAALATLADDLAGTTYAASALEWLHRHFRPAATIAAAAAGALAELLAPAGVAVLDSTHRAVKRAAAPHLLRAVELAHDLDRDLARRAAALDEVGHDAGVAVGDGATLVMLEASAGRDRLVADGRGAVTRRSKERFTAAALARIAETEPERLSPNVLLRPAVESALFPTVAYVAGPGELRYLELTGPVYERLGVRRQQPLARWSGLLVDARVDRALGKFGVELTDLLGPLRALEERIVRHQLPAAAMEALARLRAEVERQYGALQQTAREVDPTLERTIEQARRRGLGEAARVEGKLVRSLRRREAVELRQLARARTEVLPGGKPQERVIGVAPFLARHGPTLIPRLAEAIQAWYAETLEARLVAS